MAMTRTIKCPKCSQQMTRVPPLFVALERLAKGQVPICTACKTHMRLHLEVEASDGNPAYEMIILASFLPRMLPKLTEGGKEMTLYPFLVITERPGMGQAVWMPNWHVTEDGTRKERKPGQGSPFIGIRLYADMLRQVIAKGYLRVPARRVAPRSPGGAGPRNAPRNGPRTNPRT